MMMGNYALELGSKVVLKFLNLKRVQIFESLLVLFHISIMILCGPKPLLMPLGLDYRPRAILIRSSMNLRVINNLHVKYAADWSKSRGLTLYLGVCAKKLDVLR